MSSSRILARRTNVTTLTHWHIIPNATNDQIYPILAQDPTWNSFALADLEPPMREYSQFALASHDETGGQAVCLMVRHPIIGQVLSPFGAREGIAAILSQVALPERPLIQAQEMHIQVLEHYYHPETNWKGMLRMAVTSTSWQPGSDVQVRPVRLLAEADVPALKKLYSHYAESGFSADLFPQGLYVGAFERERIVAAGGTHALAPAYGVAVLGNILTAQEARGQRYGTAITAALVDALFGRGYSTIVLNVFEDNVAAIRVYERLGFQTYHRLLTGRAVTVG